MKILRHPLFLCLLGTVLLVCGINARRWHLIPSGSASSVTHPVGQASGENNADAATERDRPGRPGASNKSAKPAIPEGISEAAWTQASSLFDMIASSQFGKGGDPAKDDAEEADKLRQTLGLDPHAAPGLDALITARHEPKRQAEKESNERALSDPRGSKELIALMVMSSQQTLSPEQQTRLEDLKKQLHVDEQNPGKSSIRWQQDDAFVAAVREQLPDETASRLDDYLAKDKKEAMEQDAFHRSREMGEKLSLNADQRQAMYDLYRQNPEPGEDQILPLLNESQQATLKADPGKK
jgi:hypothetical protein